MKTYWDTSGLVRAYVLRQEPAGITRSHSVAEFFCVLSGPGLVVIEGGKTLKRALPPALAAKAVRDICSRLEFVDLNGQQAVQAMEDSTKVGHIIGKNIHDWMHCQAAEKAGVERIMTVNHADFQRMTKLRLETPSKDAPIQPGI